jgi:3-hydroxymyristoyl/3-hydroxydecanoyl-(acyl carrier protein) dehydratase
MEHIEYRGRPVAALAFETRFLRDVAPGDELQLNVEIDDVDDDAVSYRGWADVNGTRVIELNDCLGPMLPVAEFDAPEALRERFALLRDVGARPDRFHGVVDPEVTVVEHVPGESMRTAMQIPTSAPFFADHFPRRPVFPATLLLNAQIGLASALAREANAGGVRGTGSVANDAREDARVQRSRPGSRFPRRSHRHAGRRDAHRAERARSRRQDHRYGARRVRRGRSVKP